MRRGTNQKPERQPHKGIDKQEGFYYAWVNDKKTLLIKDSAVFLRL